MRTPAGVVVRARSAAAGGSRFIIFPLDGDNGGDQDGKPLHRAGVVPDCARDYRLWLDGEMVHSSAYYPHENATLEEAQRAKMDHVCRKLELRPGQRVVEAGSGWGSLAIHMARECGAKVRAFNISHERWMWCPSALLARGWAAGAVNYLV